MNRKFLLDRWQRKNSFGHLSSEPIRCQRGELDPSTLVRTTGLKKSHHAAIGLGLDAKSGNIANQIDARKMDLHGTVPAMDNYAMDNYQCTTNGVFPMIGTEWTQLALGSPCRITPPFIEWRQAKFLKVEAADPPLRCNRLFDHNSLTRVCRSPGLGSQESPQSERSAHRTVPQCSDSSRIRRSV